MGIARNLGVNYFRWHHWAVEGRFEVEASTRFTFKQAVESVIVKARAIPWSGVMHCLAGE
jgi:hypothetical protein